MASIFLEVDYGALAVVGVQRALSTGLSTGRVPAQGILPGGKALTKLTYYMDRVDIVMSNKS